MGSSKSSCLCLRRRLSQEQEGLKEALRKEAVLIQKLRQEKEELLYKLLQRDPGLGLHPSPVAPQPTPS